MDLQATKQLFTSNWQPTVNDRLRGKEISEEPSDWLVAKFNGCSSDRDYSNIEETHHLALQLINVNANDALKLIPSSCNYFLQNKPDLKTDQLGSIWTRAIVEWQPEEDTESGCGSPAPAGVP